METFAYLQIAQNYETSEHQEISFEPLNRLKRSGKITIGLLGVASTALSVAIADVAPAQAYGQGGYSGNYGHDYNNYGQGGYGGYGGYGSGYGGYGRGYGGGYGGYGGGYNSSYGGGYGYGNNYAYGGYGSSYGSGYGGGCGGNGYGGGYGGNGYGGYGGGYNTGYSGGYSDYNATSYLGVSPEDGVYNLQSALGEAGFPVAVDGVYGPETESAVVAFQSNSGLEPDGVVGPETASALGIY